MKQRSAILSFSDEIFLGFILVMKVKLQLTIDLSIHIARDRWVNGYVCIVINVTFLTRDKGVSCE